MTSPKHSGFKRRSLKRRVAIITISCSLASVLLVLFTAYQSLISDIEILLTREQVIESQRLASEVDQQLEGRVLALSSLASVLTDGERLLPVAQLQESLNRQRHVRALFSPGLVVFDAQGTAIVEDTYVPGRIGTNYRDRAHFKELIKTRRATISRPIIGRTTGAPLVSFLAPIESDDGDLLGIANGFIDLSKKTILPVTARSGTSPDDWGSLQIIDTGNMVYVAGNEDGLHLAPLPAPGDNLLIDAALSGVFFGAEADSSGSKQIYASTHLQRLGWLFVKTTSYQQAIAPARASFVNFLLWSLAGAALLAIAGFWLTQRALRPLNVIAQQITGMAGLNKAGARLPESGVYEFQPLTQAFNELALSREQKDQQVRAERDRLELQFQQSGDGIMTLDSDTLTILRLNQRISDMTGYQPQALVGKKPHDHLFTEPAKLLRYLQEVAQSAKAQHAEFKLYDANNTAIDVEISATRLMFSGHAEIMLNLRDITERNMLASLKEQFITTVSHELRTPLTSINGALKLLAAGTTGQLPEKAQHMAELGLRNGLRLQALINDLLDFSKMAAGQMQFSLVPCELSTLLNEAIQGNEPLAIHHKVTLSAGYCAPGFISVDPNRLRQILDNFISNAIKYSPASGVITLAAEPHQDKVRITVTDEGPGIPKDFRPFVFQRFAQAEVSTSHISTGTGLGLAICKELAERMNGSIGYHSEINAGTCFWVEFEKLPEP